jgi:hypothetical protein
MKDQGTRERGNKGTNDSDQRSEITYRKPLRRFAAPAIILFCAAVATLPQIVRGPSCGHDFDFHLVSWLDAQNAWRHGIAYPHWAPSPNFGAGEPRFIFYPPLTWMLGALLGIVLPWRFVPLALIFLLFAATGVATRALARQQFRDSVSTLAGCAAIFSGYALFTANERSAFAEMTGGFWVPLMFVLIVRDAAPAATPSILRHACNRSTLLLALVVAGAWLSNAPLGVMLCYLLAGAALVVALLAKSWVPILRAGTATVLGLGLSAFFLVPAAFEQRWVEIRQAVDDPGLLIENSWLFARHADPRLELHDIELIRVSAIAVAMVLMALAGVAVSWWHRTLPSDRRWWIPLALVPVIVLFLQLPISEFVWNALPKMRFLQFPWRWLVVLEAPMGIFFASAVWAGGRIWRTVVSIGCVVAVCLATVFAYVSLFQPCDEDDAVSGTLRDYRGGVGFAGTDEYAPPGADNSLVADELPFACLVTNPATRLGKGDPGMVPDWAPDQGSCDATYSQAQGFRGGSPEHLRLLADVPHAGYLVLRLRTYPAWGVRVNGRPVASMPSRDDGLMTVPVPQGRVDLAADWTITPDVLAGRVISIAALALITMLWLWERRPSRARLS